MIAALRMCKRVLEDESELGDIEASFVATEMIDAALAQPLAQASAEEPFKKKGRLIL